MISVGKVFVYTGAPLHSEVKGQGQPQSSTSGAAADSRTVQQDGRLPTLEIKLQSVSWWKVSLFLLQRVTWHFLLLRLVNVPHLVTQTASLWTSGFSTFFFLNLWKLSVFTFRLLTSCFMCMQVLLFSSCLRFLSMLEWNRWVMIPLIPAYNNWYLKWYLNQHWRI